MVDGPPAWTSAAGTYLDRPLGPSVPMSVHPGGRPPTQGSCHGHDAQTKVPKPVPDVEPDVPSQPFLDDQLYGRTTKAAKGAKRAKAPAAADASSQAYVDAAVEGAGVCIKRDAPMPFKRLPEEIIQSVEALRPPRALDPRLEVLVGVLPGFSGCGRRAPTGSATCRQQRMRAATKLPFTAANRALLTRSGNGDGGAGSRSPAARIRRSTPA